LIKAVDKAFSRYIRKKHMDHAGWVECVTCGLSVPYEDIQAGHFVKRGHAAVRWDERNVYPQCKQCNHFRDGAQDEMANHIVKIHGERVLAELIVLKHTHKHWTMPELRELRERYEEK
jgi:hypothetical protein